MDDLKAKEERLVFAEFVRVARTDIDPATIESRTPREPDIRCATWDGQPLAFELAEICSEELARDLTEVRRDPDRIPEQRWPPDPTEAVYRKKIAKAYSAPNTDLLLYTDGRAVTPDDVIEAALPNLIKTIGKGPFIRIYFMGKARWREIV